MRLTMLDVGHDSLVYCTKSVKNPRRKNKCTVDVRVYRQKNGFPSRVLFSSPRILHSDAVQGAEAELTQMDLCFDNPLHC